MQTNDVEHLEAACGAHENSPSSYKSGTGQGLFLLLLLLLF